MDIFQQIKSFFKKPQKDAFGLIFEDYLKIKSELQFSDINTEGEEINFKVNYRGCTVPFWLDKKPGINAEKATIKVREIMAVIAMGLAIDLNLVEISQILKKSQNLL